MQAPGVALKGPGLDTDPEHDVQMDTKAAAATWPRHTGGSEAGWLKRLPAAQGWKSKLVIEFLRGKKKFLQQR